MVATKRLKVTSESLDARVANGAVLRVEIKKRHASEYHLTEVGGA